MRLINVCLAFTLILLAATGFAQPLYRCQDENALAKKTSDATWAWDNNKALSETQIQGVALFVHGLNTKPARMESLQQLFQAKNFKTINITLAGHGGSLEAMKTATREEWLHDLFRGYCQAKNKAETLRVPLYFVGYSLGGLIGTDLATNPDFETTPYDKVVLLAPAVAVKASSKLIKVFKIFGPRFVVPSANVKSYRANKSGTSIAAYNSLFASLKAIQGRDLTQANVPTLVVVDPKDELVSAPRIQTLINDKKLTMWQFQLINNDGSVLEKRYHHLMIDEPSMGAKNWQLLKSWILKFTL